MNSRAVTYLAYAVLIVAAGILVGVTVKGEHPKPVERGPEAARAAAAEEVVCAVCGRKGPRDQMRLLELESPGYAPDSLPVWVCSEVCGEAVLADPEKYRNATISEVEKAATDE